MASGGRRWTFGRGAPAFVVHVRREAGLPRRPHELALAHSYIRGDLEVEGDWLAMLDARDRWSTEPTWSQRALFGLQLLMPATWSNARAIDAHYTRGDDFYLSFIERRYRFYSHCLFAHPEQSLEDAAERKLETMWHALGLEPGMRLLDIGGGWGGVTQYCGERGVHVTSLTLTEDSARYIRGLIAERDLPGEVIVEDILDHQSERPYDHAVIYGVIEHVPNYRHFCAKVWDLLPPGGRLYMDASAAHRKFLTSAFTRRYIWGGHHSFLCLQDIVQELLLHGFTLEEVVCETQDYGLTMQHWARRLEEARAFIEEGWGEETYRAFRLYLWGGAHTFATNRLQAYHLVAERRAAAGLRPGLLSRAASFALSLR